ncbi:MAG: FmdB family zinc ribbon protein [Acidimicrobiia bacterium]
MPLYEFRCRICGETFEVRRQMADADQAAPCPHGHAETLRLLPLVALGGRDTGPAPVPAAPAGGGCCGGACGCG